MKILYVCADSGVSLSKHNGSAAHLRAVVAAFGELGHEVELLMTDVGGADALHVPVHAIPRPRFAPALNGLASPGSERDEATALLRALRRIWVNGGLESSLTDRIDRWRPDLVYERHSPFSVAGAVTARRLGCPHVLEVNAPLAWEGARHRGQVLGDAAGLLEQAALAATSRIVAVSGDLRDQLVADGVDASKIRVVPNGVDPRRFRPDGPSLPVGLERKRVVGFVGSLKAWHGIEVLAEAFETLAVDPDLHLLVVGDGPMAGPLADLERRLPGRVTLTGSVPPAEVPAYLRAMHVAVAPYPDLERFYFSPLKVLEYMASGVAVVASRIGQLRELVRDGDTGLLVQPGDSEALARAVSRLVGDETLRKNMGRHAREEALREHTWTRRVADILAAGPVAA